MHNNLINDTNNFFAKCDDLINSKFILADTKITDLLSSIVESQTLFNLFEMLTTDFDYISYKKACFKNDNAGERAVKLPEGTGDKIAFIFCILMEVDRKTLDFSAFLQQYFYEDGSYFESYSAFCNQLIKPFKVLVKAAVEEISTDDLINGSIGVEVENNKKIITILKEDALIVTKTKLIGDTEKAQLIAFIENFIDAVKKKSSYKASFLLAYKYICDAHKNFLKQYSSLIKFF